MLRPSKYERGEGLHNRGIVGTYNRVSPKHLQRYATEFDGRHNDPLSDILVQMKSLIKGPYGKCLSYDDLTS